MADTSLGSLIVSIGADIKGFQDAMSSVSDSLSSLQDTASSALSHFDTLVGGIGDVAAAVGIATSAFDLCKDALEDVSHAEDAQTSFALLTGSTTDAKNAFDSLKDSANNLAVPFGDLLSVAQNLAPQFGVGTQELQNALTAAADSAAATGRNFDTVAQSLDRISTSGSVGARQLAQLGISMQDVVTAMGVSVTQATAALTKGAQSAQADVSDVVDAIEAKFGGAAQAMATNLSGQLTTLKNGLTSLSEDLGTALAPLASDLISGLEDIEPTIKDIIDNGITPLASGIQSFLGDLKSGFEAAAPQISALKDQFTGLGTSISALSSESGLLQGLKDMNTYATLLGAAIEVLVSKLNIFSAASGISGLAMTALNAILAEISGTVGLAALSHDALTKAMQGTLSAADPWNTTAMQLAQSQLAADNAARSQADGVNSLGLAFQTLGAKVPPTQASLNNLADALETIQAAYVANQIPLSTYNAAIDDFTKKMNSLQGAFVAAALPVDTLGQALKAAGIQNSTDQIEKLQEGVAAAGAAFDLGRIPASDYASEIDKLTALEQKNATDGVAGLTTALTIAGEQYATGKIGLDALGDSLNNLVQILPGFQDGISKQNDAIATLNVSMDTITSTVPTVAQILTSFGQETADDVTAHIKTLQDQLDAANQAMQMGVPGAAQAATAAMDALLAETQKLSNAALDDKALGIPNFLDLQNTLSKTQTAYQDLVNSGTASGAELNAAWISALTTEQNTFAANGQTLTAGDQTTLAQLKQQHKDFIDDQVNQWGNLFNTIDSDVQSTATSLTNTLFTGSGSFHDEAIKGLEDIGAAVVTAFTKPFTDAVASLIAGAITNLLSGNGLGGILTSLQNIGSAATSAFKSISDGAASLNLGGLFSNSASSIGAPGTGAIGDTVSTGDTLAGVGEPSSSATSTIASGVSSGLTGVISAIGSIGSLVTGVISDFQNAQQETTLNAIEENTRITAIAMEGNWQSGTDTETMFAFSKSTMQATQGILQTLQTTTHDDMVALISAVGGGAQAPTVDFFTDEFNSLIDALNGPSSTTAGSLSDLMSFNWGTLHPDLVAIQNGIGGAVANLVYIAQHMGGGTLVPTSAVGAGITSTSGTVDASTQLPGLEEFIGMVNEAVASGAINTYMESPGTDAQKTVTDLLTSISASLTGLATAVADANTQMVTGFNATVGQLMTMEALEINQVVPRLDQMATNTAVLAARSPTNITIQGNVIGNQDFINQLTNAVAQQLNLQGVPAVA